jgi:hypothetical protein
MEESRGKLRCDEEAREWRNLFVARYTA